MTNTFLSLYRLFFIDENEKIWAVFKDGRVCFVKNGFAFCAFSSDRKGILGVSFRQNETAVLALDLRFSQREPYPLLHVQGYVYYPALLIQKKLRLAFLEADLLSRKGCGNLVVSERPRTRFKRVFQTSARIAPPVFHQKTGDLFFIGADQRLYCLNKETFEQVCLAEGVSAFTLHEERGLIAILKEENLIIFDAAGQTLGTFSVSRPTAISFSVAGDEVFVASDRMGRCELCAYDWRSGQVAFIASHASRIVGLCR